MNLHLAKQYSIRMVHGLTMISEDNEVADEDMGMLPIYIGVDGEENQGLCTGSENYWCVNKNASEEDIQATLDFMKWVVEQR